ncbi:glycosylhydrolase-like jelly roll fold domain-containing protein, partial [Pedobacter sp.]|uniref:glycosylhydrolase-like jelly roll fold domain-containing protein n=1 Tax=Pedobacter sp. TaxID=1411316 RepID=UPI003C64556D
DKDGENWQPVPEIPNHALSLKSAWQMELKHMDGTSRNEEMLKLTDLKDIPHLVHFAGMVSYKYVLELSNAKDFSYLDLGKVSGISTLLVNGQALDVSWYGRRAYLIKNLLKAGTNQIEIKVTTVMVNYMKSLTENATAQYWTNNKGKEQPLQSMGLIGPVNLF